MPTSNQPPRKPPQVSVTAFLAHRRMVMCLFFSTLLVTGYLSESIQAKNPSLLKAVALSGALGGFVSALRRFYAFDGTEAPTPAMLALGRSHFYSFIHALIPPLLGVIGATVLYVIMAGQLVQAAVFPHFAYLPDPRDCPSTHFAEFVYNWKPATPADYAKALVWSFAAGFSERFVPDLLGKLTAQVDK